MSAAALWRLAAAAFIAAALLVASGESRPALAHSTLLAHDPADGAVLATRPAAFRLTFNEPISPLVMKLAAPDGTVSDLPRPKAEGALLTAAAPDRMPDGTYALSWRVVSLDGHPVGGTIVFSIGHPSAGPPSGIRPVGTAVMFAIWLSRLVLYIGLFFAAGAGLFRALIAPLPGPARVFALILAATGIAAATLSVGLQGLDALAAPPGGYFHAPVWLAGYSTTYGITATVAALALGAAIAGLTVRSRRAARLLAFAAVAGVGLALAASGHASDASPQWLTRPAVFLHAVALTAWLGALPPLALVLWRGGDGAVPALARFSRLIPLAIAPLVLSGLTLAAIQLGRPAALFETAYGQVLLAKLALLAALFALAGWNRWSLTGRVETGAKPARHRMARSIAVEILLVTTILGVVALWRFTPPPRALAEAVASPVQVHLHSEKAMAMLTLSSGRVGRISASIEVMSAEGRALAAKEVSLTFAAPAIGVEAITRAAHTVGDGIWRVDDLVMPLPGAWSARVDILVGDFEKVRLEAQVEIAP